MGKQGIASILFVIAIVMIIFMFRKSYIAKKITWKSGMLAGIIFILVVGIIPMIVAEIQKQFFNYPQWSEYLVIPFCFQFVIMYSVMDVGESPNVFIYVIYFIITSVIIYGSIGTVIGYMLQDKNPKPKKE